MSSSKNKMLERKEIWLKSGLDKVAEKLEQMVNHLGKSFAYNPMIDWCSKTDFLDRPFSLHLAGYPDIEPYIMLKDGKKFKEWEKFTLKSLVSVLPNIVYATTHDDVNSEFARVSFPSSFYYSLRFETGLSFRSVFEPRELLQKKVSELLVRVLPEKVATGYKFTGSHYPSIENSYYDTVREKLSSVGKMNWLIELSFYDIEKDYWKQVKRELKHIWKSK